MSYRNHPITDYRAVAGPGSVLVDVREPGEVASGSLPDAINIPVGELPHRLGELDRGARILLFCRSGGRSAHAAELLTQAGFGDVTNLEGGMLAWNEG